MVYVILNHQSIRNLKGHAYASPPFGVGSRISRRMADLEMDLIASMVKNFEILHPDDNEEITIELKMILEPSKPINLRLKPRTTS